MIAEEIEAAFDFPILLQRMSPEVAPTGPPEMSAVRNIDGVKRSHYRRPCLS
jgi:hypothetical protein